MTHLRQIMLEELRRRHFADSTIRSYLHAIEHYSRYFHRRLGGRRRTGSRSRRQISVLRTGRVKCYAGDSPLELTKQTVNRYSELFPVTRVLRSTSGPFRRLKCTNHAEISYANVGIGLGRGIDRANQGFPLLQAQWAEYAPSRMLRGAYPHPPHPRYETADLAMIRQGI